MVFMREFHVSINMTDVFQDCIKENLYFLLFYNVDLLIKFITTCQMSLSYANAGTAEDKDSKRFTTGLLSTLNWCEGSAERKCVFHIGRKDRI